MGDGEVREPHLSECKGYITSVAHCVGICLSLTGCVRSQKAKFYWVSSTTCHPDLKVGIKNWILFLTNPPKNLILLHQQGSTRKKVSFGFINPKNWVYQVMWNLFGQVCQHVTWVWVTTIPCVSKYIYFKKFQVPDDSYPNRLPTYLSFKKFDTNQSI